MISNDFRKYLTAVNKSVLIVWKNKTHDTEMLPAVFTQNLQLLPTKAMLLAGRRVFLAAYNRSTKPVLPEVYNN